MFRKHYDKFLLLAGLLVVVASALAFSGKGTEVTAPPMRAGASYTPQAVSVPAAEVATWPAPPAQSAGALWVYEVFTPPKVYFNPTSGEFTVVPPSQLQAPREVPFGLELVDVFQEPYRIQLVGFLGERGSYRMNLENAETGEVLLARPTDRRPELDLEVLSFEVREVAVPNPGGTPIKDTVAYATIRDLRIGEVVTLNSKERRFLATPRARFRTVTTPPSAVLLREGEAEQVGDSLYTLKSLTINPPAAVVERDPDGDGETTVRTLTPVAADAASTSAATSTP